MAEQDRVVIVEGKMPVVSTKRCIFVGFLGGLLAAAIFLVLYFFLPVAKKSTMSSATPTSYNIDQVIAAVKRDLAKAQLQQEQGSVGPSFFIRDFDMEVNLEFSIEATMGLEGTPVVKVSGSSSQGQGQTIRLRFESLGYEVTKLLVEQCARLYLLPTIPALDKDSIQKDKDLIQKLPDPLKERPVEDPKARFTKCVEGRLPRDIDVMVKSLMLERKP
ncbi:MAG: hypothetical protein QXT73_02955 [Candidatus Methanomethylicaceae archaeon]